LFGKERVERILLSHDGDHVDFLDHLLGTTMAFNGGDSPRDDCTAVAIDFHRGPQGRSSAEEPHG
jgi:hypothetical protein